VLTADYVLHHFVPGKKFLRPHALSAEHKRNEAATSATTLMTASTKLVKAMIISDRVTQME